VEFSIDQAAFTRASKDVIDEEILSDISQFNRLFRARFGDTPRRARASLT
jgi:AraC-like DNA-binding protein